MNTRPKRHYIVWQMFQDASNFMKNGTKLRQMINALNGKDFTNASDTHEFGDMYESMLKDLQESKRDGGEFYTPRALTDFIIEKVDPCLGEKIADFACGTGGFLVSALKHLTAKVQTTEDLDLCRQNLHGIEKKSFPYSLCMTNMILHDVDNPNIVYGNSLNKNVRDIKDSEKFDVILMNPPYGGSEDEIIQMNFPQEFRCAETANLFMAVIMYRLNTSGRVGVVLPDGFLFSTDGAERNLKEKLFSEFNLHTVLRLPKSVFAPYTPIATNVLFFEKDADGTKNTWFYRMDIPSDRKAFSKTKPIKSAHFQPIRDWWSNREEIQDEEGNYKARCYSRKEIAEGNYNLDLCGFPHKVEEILEPKELIDNYQSSQDKFVRHVTDLLKELGQSISNPFYSPKHIPATTLSYAIAEIIKLNTSLDNQLRKSVLQYAIQGKLVPQNPDDEPAYVLLDRISAEKSRLISEGKIKRDRNDSVIFRNNNGQFIERIGKTEIDVTDQIPFDIPNSWVWVKLGNITYNVGNKNNQIQSKDILKVGSIPVVSQGQNLVDGFCENREKVITNLPLIMFGDHTRNVKYVDFPFVIGADGTKFHKCIVINPRYIYFWMTIIAEQLRDRGYARHYSLLKECLIPLPPLEEQKRIVERIEQIFSLC